MEEKSTGTVQITSAEYRELVEKAVREEVSASEYRSKFWKAESDLKAAKAELEKVRAELLTTQEQLEKTKEQLTSPFSPFSKEYINWCASTSAGGAANE